MKVIMQLDGDCMLPLHTIKTACPMCHQAVVFAIPNGAMGYEDERDYWRELAMKLNTECKRLAKELKGPEIDPVEDLRRKWAEWTEWLFTVEKAKRVEILQHLIQHNGPAPDYLGPRLREALSSP